MTKAFSDLMFVFEIANNHQGDVEHGRRIISEMGQIAARHSIQAAVKLQYRELDTFIHPDYVGRSDVKHIPRFLGTRLSHCMFCLGCDLTFSKTGPDSFHRCLHPCCSHFCSASNTIDLFISPSFPNCIPAI